MSWSALEKKILAYETIGQKKTKVQRKHRYKKKKKKRYMRDESRYNLIQEHEFDIFIEYLPILVEVALTEILSSAVSEAKFQRMYTALLALLLKRYVIKSYRRGMGFVRYVFKHSFHNLKVPCFKTLNNYVLKGNTEHAIDRIIYQSASLLRDIEKSFNTDSTGEATIVFSPWYSIRIGRRIRRRMHATSHITCTTLANMVVCVDVENGNDINIMVSHVEKTSCNFIIEDWQVDAKYLARKVCNAVYEHGGKAHIRIKSNTTAKPKNSPEWKRMVLAQKRKDKQELDQLNKRQNVESTIHAKKRKCGDGTSAKDKTAQINDIKLSWSVYNMTVLPRLIYEFGIEIGA
jgi:hypothetical protein